MQGGQYRKIFGTEGGEICTNAYNETFREYYDKFQAAQTIQVPWKTCPYPDGPNEINNFYVEDYGGLLPAYVPGSEKWKVEVMFYENDTVKVGGYNIYMTLRNEKSLLNG